MREVGALSIKLEYQLHRVQGARLCIPLLGIDEHLPRYSRFENLPAGTYDATLILYLVNGGEIKQTRKVRILPNQENLHQFHFSALEQDIFLRPVDAGGRTVLSAEIKIEGVDPNFRTVRDWRGIPFRLRPGNYQVKVLLPNLQTKTLPLAVTGDVYNYTLILEDKPTPSRREPRIPLTIPVDYRTSEGSWISTQTVNLSGRGICLIKKPSRITDRNTYVRLFVPPPFGPLECQARVRWEKEGVVPYMGMELLLNSSAKMRLTDWLQQSSHS
jgi:hypothetical protein